MTGKERVKQIRVETDPAVIGRRLEAHHIDPLYERPEKEKLIGLTLPEHAQIHRLMANNGENPDGNFWATKEIVKRMTYQELNEFNRMINVRK